MNPEAPKLDDARLLPLLRAGDEAAWREVVVALKKRITSVVKKSLHGDEHEAEEVAMEAFQRLHRGIANFRGDCKIDSYVFSIAINLSRNRYWYNERRRRADHVSLDYRPADSTGDLHEAIPDETPNPAKIHELAEIGERLRFALPKIPILQRAAVELCMSGKTYREIAELVGTSMGTVKSRIARGRDALRLEMRLAS